ncbi:MAG: amino-acid N-acetyltransferase [Gammaproteobacteria bacterium]|nr:amino-acid N-acetyltransferase [Gammaproteobacteria bacterium]
MNQPQSADTSGDAVVPSDPDSHIEWFRQASPYINAHRGKTFVLCFSGSALVSPLFPTLIHDITLLHHLGIRLVLTHGLRHQLDEHLQLLAVNSTRVNGLRITTDQVLDAVVAEVGKARIFIESRLSMGLPNTPMSGSHLSVASGNFITAQPYGVHDGVDFCHTGIVRQVHVNAIRRQIEHGQLVLLSPLGYSLTGELFNLQSVDVAMQTAAALDAEKLIYIDQPLTDSTNHPIRESTPRAMEKLLADLDVSHPGVESARKAIDACRAGVQRAHLLDYQDPYSLLKELFTLDGTGTMISADTYDLIRRADIRDVNGIIELIRPLEENGTLVKRSREQLELEIKHFHVAERDGRVVACAALIPSSDKHGSGPAEIACVVTHPDYRKSGRAEKLLQHLEAAASSAGINTLFVFTTRSDHWFIEQGYTPGNADVVPHDRLARVTPERNSRILLKHL